MGRNIIMMNKNQNNSLGKHPTVIASTLFNLLRVPSVALVKLAAQV